LIVGRTDEHGADPRAGLRVVCPSLGFVAERLQQLGASGEACFDARRRGTRGLAAIGNAFAGCARGVAAP